MKYTSASAAARIDRRILKIAVLGSSVRGRMVFNSFFEFIISLEEIGLWSRE